MPTKSEIASLLFLLEDPDPTVQHSVRSRLHELGEQAVPLLDQHRSEVRDKDERERINDIIFSITFSSVEEDFMELLEHGVDNTKQLEDLMLTLARFGNPTLRAEEYKRKLDRFADMVRSDIRYRVSDSDKMKRLLRFVFDDLNFRGNTEDYHNPENSYLNEVIDQRKGLPITLAMVVLFLARRLDLPFHGVNMPIHFMLKFESGQQSVLIDPFDGGTLVSYDQCFSFLRKNGVEPKAEHFEAAPPVTILQRAIRNLVHSYARRKDEKRVDRLRELLSTVEMMQH